MRPQYLVRLVVCSLLSLGLPTTLAIAEEDVPPAPARSICPICRNAADNQAVDYPTKATHTLVRGATNFFFGWTDAIRQPAEEAKAGGNVFTGILKGIGQGVGRTVAGAGEVLTFWTPKDKNGYLHFSTDCPVCVKR